MIDPRLLTCAHRRCRHLTGGSQCGLLLSGQRIVLNAVGQCEMMEAKKEVHRNEDAPEGTACDAHRCDRPAMSLCVRCRKAICAQHRRWVPNGGIGPHGELEQHAHCDVCAIRFVRDITGSDIDLVMDDLTLDNDDLMTL